ncbi:F0F1 ATP synthase subunit B family protein [Echinicola shivajiensis]|uniref:F0F1 ATP synthase subunit B family protein n=1 Tax=Echinicola shivajiensis TaxID=1035916 RepID=UPI001BFCC8CA|nr:hypothetical protein [Echinicola shivajiensis]
MLIDWFTILAQVINFLVLVLLLKRFLYRPILKAVHDREEKIRQELEKSEKVLYEANSELKSYQKKNAEFEQEKQKMLQVVEDEARKKKEELIKLAKEEVKILSERLKDSLDREQRGLQDEIYKKMVREIFLMCKKLLGELANVKLEALMADVFLDRIGDKKQQVDGQLFEGLKSASGPIILQSSFVLPDSLQESFKEKLEALVGRSVNLRFETSSENISGFTLKTQNYQYSWNLMEYLERWEDKVQDTLNNSILGKSGKLESKDQDHGKPI